MKKMPKAGDIFSFQIAPDEFAFGRVMLNLRTQCFDKELIGSANPLNYFKDGKFILADLYRETSSGDLPEGRSIAISGILTTYSLLMLGIWKIVGFESVNPQEVDFPEGVSVESVTKAALVRGELSLSFNMNIKEVEKIGIYPQTFPPSMLSEILLFNLGRGNEINNKNSENKDFLDMSNLDLRYSKYRERVYELLGEDMNESYYDKACRYGFDLKRFY
ncbi:Imm26 family immunity protein [Nitrosomonas sp.]|uniref:Imm26 family immunity protein n=1 Tax=Nitrosomonas sp. TaxID=42353 RepID=UPI00262752D2|nr:Imm26 family immunity protein [Nitrosomonas sp.]MCW5599987.1 hypothetical protein [Nitrosomonas sp.]